MSHNLVATAIQTLVRVEIWPALPVMITDTDTGEILYCSESVAETFGYTVDDLEGREIEILVPTKFVDAHKKWRNDTAGRKHSSLGKFRPLLGRRRDGKEVEVSVGLAHLELSNHLFTMVMVIDLSNTISTKETVTP